MSQKLPVRERVPDYHYECEQSAAVIDSVAEAALKARTAFEDVLAQFFVSTATWGLKHWEGQVGLQTDESLSVDVRRAAVQQKLQANGNTTAEMVREMAESITGYEARVHVDPSDYSFTLEFLGDTPQIAGIDFFGILDTVEQIKPAHLRFLISQITWQDLEDVAMTWQRFEEGAFTWSKLETSICIRKK